MERERRPLKKKRPPPPPPPPPPKGHHPINYICLCNCMRDAQGKDRTGQDRTGQGKKKYIYIFFFKKNLEGAERSPLPRPLSLS